MPKVEPIHTEEHIRLHVAGKGRRVKLLRYLGETWVPLKVLEEALEPDQVEETEKEQSDG
jgi:hypothetical protein